MRANKKKSSDSYASEKYTQFRLLLRKNQYSKSTMTIHSSAFDDQENKHASCVPFVHQYEYSRNPLKPLKFAPLEAKSKKVSALIRLFGKRSSKAKVNYSVSSERFRLHL
jgi:hypothetical protein